MQSTPDNAYLMEVHRTLPRLLALYDTDVTSPTYGTGDRLHWAWKLIDFGNGTFQGAVHGLARLLSADLLPAALSGSAVHRRIDAMFEGAGRLRRRNGSMEEAFPYESSFCVTALVAYDLLSAIQLLDARLDATQRDRYLAIVAPMIAFLHRADETHAFISNHLATAAAACFQWHALTGDGGEARGRELLDRILGEQSDEGWFREYEGADPGYQSLCTYYLADLHRARPDLGLQEPLRKSVEFLQYFAHPDGSFGGTYGSRSTRFFVPAGVELLADEIPEAAVLAAHMRAAVVDGATPTLGVMDAPNLVPMFNAYCLAARTLVERGARTVSDPQLPCRDTPNHPTWRREFGEAGLIVDKGSGHYTIVSTHRGGVCYHFTTDGRSRRDAGTVYRTADDAMLTNQRYASDNVVEMNGDALRVMARLTKRSRPMPTPLRFTILRMLNLTVMRWRPIAEWVKQCLVRLLITGAKRTGGTNVRTIHLGPDLTIEDHPEGMAPLERVPTPHGFNAIHMASQGYWQKQDDAE